MASASLTAILSNAFLLMTALNFPTYHIGWTRFRGHRAINLRPGGCAGGEPQQEKSMHFCVFNPTAVSAMAGARHDGYATPARRGPRVDRKDDPIEVRPFAEQQV
jgi:hypothetical protein